MQKLFQSNRNNQDIFLIRRVLKGRAARTVWGHSPPENFELLILWNAISGVLRGQFLSKMFTKSIVILSLFLFAWFWVQVLDFILYYFVQFLKFSGHQFLLSIICYVFLYKYRKSSFGNVKIGIFFPTLITYWSGFRIFKQNWENPDENRDGQLVKRLT